ncbi:MAG: hypothetical protein F2947_00700 [Actinobacteria bacterium]|uniref:Unannotated protein n=1 Tax=freshwater metagenome TaxID=449393 RepID=A0A6J5ZEA9_9ZZZZ|nr:hypothetical protein [Actinomycetota bacterium]MSX34125.1 hypothetical protein [Actinomycetota bacterium]MSY24616.1 hypothetical protein [Actinomycetota bacterium]MSY33507.1 hypothetical protein [Actinomycetota bacterium]MTA42456.1 hypothetical protein [Actinomycetota bacterium]
MSEPELSDVLAELRDLRAEVTTLRAQVAEQAPPEPVSHPLPPISNSRETLDVDGTDAVSRRHALRTAGMVAAGALAGGAALVAAAGPAAATGPTVFDADGVNPAITANGSSSRDAIHASASANGIHGVYSVASGGGYAYGVWGIADTNVFNVGVQGSAYLGSGVKGTSYSGTGVLGVSNTGKAMYASSIAGYGIEAQSTDAQAVYATSTNNTAGQFSGVVGVNAFGYNQGGLGGTGLRALGDRASIYIEPQGAARPSLSYSYNAGDLHVDSSGALWFCAASGIGASATWRQLASTTSAGSFHPVTPGRVYDSRLSTYLQHGTLGSGQNRTLSVASSFDVNGTLVNSDFVPAGATAVFANVTIVDTVGAGYLAINPGGTTTVAASTINWSASGQILANGISLTLNSTRQITVVNGSGGATQFIIDITGYWM